MTIHRVPRQRLLPFAWLLALAISGFALGQGTAPPAATGAKAIPPPPAPRQYEEPRIAAFLAKASECIRVGEARATFKVSGDGYAVAIVDTDLRVTHKDFTGRVPAQVNFTMENGGKLNDTTDLVGHGTHVAGIVAAGGIHTGMAPKARVIPLKVLEKTGGSWDTVEKALKWVLDNHKKHQYG